MASWITRTFMLSSLFLLGNAVPISRNEFKPSAVNYAPVLDSTTSGKRILTDNNLLTITGGFVVFLSISPGDAYIYYDGFDNSVITMSFSDPVSAIGMDWISNNASVILTVFNAQNVTLDSLTLDWTQFPKKGVPPSPYGFSGIDVGQNAISYATIDTAFEPGNELFVGKWIYQPPDVNPDFLSPKQSPSPDQSPAVESPKESPDNASPEPSPAVASPDQSPAVASPSPTQSPAVASPSPNQSPAVASASPNQSPAVASPKPSPSCEHCNEAFRTAECQLQETQHPSFLSVDIMNCNVGDIDAIKQTYGCVQHVPGCDTWVCTEFIPEDVILQLSSCPPVIVGSLFTSVNP